MRAIPKNYLSRLAYGALISFNLGCSSAVEPSVKMGTVEFQITDAPVDDDGVLGVFVTVSDLRIDGNPSEGFMKQTIDLHSLSEGKTQLLGTSTLVAKSYSSVTLQIEVDVDAGGNAPGSYVQAIDGAKYKLKEGGSTELVFSNRWSALPNARSVIILDLDLRKAIARSSDPLMKYTFVDSASLKAATRAVSKELTGSIVGTYIEQSPTGADKVIAYAYKRGSFDASIETQTQTPDGLLFNNAVTSATVTITGTNGAFTLPFLEAGDYEVHFAAYNRNASTGEFTFEQMLTATTMFRGAPADFVTVLAGIIATPASTITGL